MARLTERPRVELNVNFELTEPEVLALYALTEYGDDAFLKHFYERLGESCLKPHEKGLRSLFESIRRDLTPILDRARQARVVFTRVPEFTSDRPLVAAARGKQPDPVEPF